MHTIANSFVNILLPQSYALFLQICRPSSNTMVCPTNACQGSPPVRLHLWTLNLNHFTPDLFQISLINFYHSNMSFVR